MKNKTPMIAYFSIYGCPKCGCHKFVSEEDSLYENAEKVLECASCGLSYILDCFRCRHIVTGVSIKAGEKYACTKCQKWTDIVGE